MCVKSDKYFPNQLNDSIYIYVVVNNRLSYSGPLFQENNGQRLIDTHPLVR